MNIRTRTLAGFIAKEFTQIFRDPKMIVALFFIPLMQLIMFGLALTSEVKNIEFAVVSRPSALAREVQTRALASGWFKKAEQIDGANVPDPAALLTQRRAEAVLVAPAEGLEAALEPTGGSIDLGSLAQLMGGMEQLASSYAEFNEALKAYTGGVDALAENWPSIQNGINSLTSGASSLSDGTAALDEETQAIPDQLDGLLGTGDEDSEYTPESFLDERNGEPDSVQFVISTEGIELPETGGSDEPAPAEQGFFARLWSKIVALFT